MRVAIVGPCSPREFASYLGVSGDELPLGLGGTPVNSLVKNLLASGHTVHLVGVSADVMEVKHFEKRNLYVSIVPYRQRAKDRALDFFRRERNALAGELPRVRVDVVHAHWSYEFGWVGTRAGLPNVLTVHDAPLTILRRMPDAYRFLRASLAYAVRLRASVVTAVSPDLADKWKRQMCFPGVVHVVPNISPEFEPSQPVAAIGGGKVVVTDIADGTPLKNVRKLLVAFDRFRRDVPHAELRLIGSGLGENGELAVWARRNDMAEGVRFLGRLSRNSVSRHLGESTMLCHASLEESQGMCFLEAMSHSVPIIGGVNSGGVAWTLDDGSAGLLVDVTNSDEIYRGMLRLHENKELRSSLIARGLALVKGRYSAEAVVGAYIDAYRSAVASYGRNQDDRS